MTVLRFKLLIYKDGIELMDPNLDVSITGVLAIIQKSIIRALQEAMALGISKIESLK